MDYGRSNPPLPWAQIVAACADAEVELKELLHKEKVITSEIVQCRRLQSYPEHENEDQYEKLKHHLKARTNLQEQILEVRSKLRKGLKSLIRQHVGYFQKTREGLNLSPSHELSSGARSSSEYCDEDTEIDFHSRLWKLCFYKQINDMKYNISQFQDALEKSQQKILKLEAELTGVSLDSRRRAELERRKVKLSKEAGEFNELLDGFRTFLEQGIAFYLKLLNELQSQISLLRLVGADNGNELSGLSEQIVAEVVTGRGNQMEWHIRRSIYRCYLSLGDLARYKEQYFSDTFKQSSNRAAALVDAEPLKSGRAGVAHNYYNLARIVCPSPGNPFNQMAVLATYRSKMDEACYYYCRSIASSEPFYGGLENLSILFEKNASEFRTMKSLHWNSRKATDLVANDKRFKEFIIKYVHLHGLLFEMSVGMHVEYLTNSQNGNERINKKWKAVLDAAHQRRSNEPVHLATLLSSEAIGDLIADVMSEVEFFVEFAAKSFDQQPIKMIQSNIFASYESVSYFLLRLLVVSLFSVQFAVPTNVNALFVSNEKHYSGNRERSISESVALQVLYSFVARVARVTTKVVSSLKAPKLQGRVELAQKDYSFFHSVMPVLSLFSQWGKVHVGYTLMEPTQSALGGLMGNPEHLSEKRAALPAIFRDATMEQGNIVSDSKFKLFESTPELLGTEVRTRGSARVALAELCSICQMHFSSPQQATVVDEVLWEHIEVLGYLPLHMVTIGDVDFNRLSTQLDGLQLYSSAQKEKRAQYLQYFVSLFSNFRAATSKEDKRREDVDTLQHTFKDAGKDAAKKKKEKMKSRSNNSTKAEAPATGTPLISATSQGKNSAHAILEPNEENYDELAGETIVYQPSPWWGVDFGKSLMDSSMLSHNCSAQNLQSLRLQDGLETEAKMLAESDYSHTTSFQLEAVGHRDCAELANSKVPKCPADAFYDNDDDDDVLFVGNPFHMQPLQLSSDISSATSNFDPFDMIVTESGHVRSFGHVGNPPGFSATSMQTTMIPPPGLVTDKHKDTFASAQSFAVVRPPGL